MHSLRFPTCLALFAALVPRPSLSRGTNAPGIGAAMQEMVAKREVTGAVTVVVTKDNVLHLEAPAWRCGSKRPMKSDTLFWMRLDDQADHRHRRAHAPG